jgi:RNA polymerase sigma-70 factor (ECF subfamily)
MDSDASPPADLASHAAFVRRLAFHLLRRDADADDAAQETLARAVERPPRGGDGLRAWLAAVLKNVVSGGRRAEARRRRREEVAARPEGTRGPDAAAGNAQILRVVADAVASLDAPHREVVMLRHYEGLPPREIATRLGLPVETVKSRLKRAHERLRERLDERRGGNVEGWRSALAGFAGLDVLEKTALPVGGAIAVGTATKVGVGVAAALAIGAGAWRLSTGEEERVAEEPASPAVAGADPVATPTLARADGRAPATRVEQGSIDVPKAAVPEVAGAEVTLVDVTSVNDGLTPIDVVEVVVLGKRAGQEAEVTIGPDPATGGPKRALLEKTVSLPPDGVIRFVDVPKGSYRLLVRGPGETTRTWSLLVPQRPDGNHRQPIVFGSATIEGRAFERTGQPAKGRTIYLAPAGPWQMLGSPSAVTARADDQGRFRFEGLLPGAYGVSVQFDPFPGGGQDFRTAPAKVASGETAHVDLGAERAEPVWSGTARLKSGTRVRGPRMIFLQGKAQAFVAIGPDGYFSQRLPPDTYRASIAFPGRIGSHDFEVRIGATDLSGDVAVGGVRVEGTLLDAGTGKPLPVGWWETTPTVTLTAVGETPRSFDVVRPDAEGAFSFDGILPGKYRVFATAPKAKPGTGIESIVEVGEDRDLRGIALELRLP